MYSVLLFSRSHRPDGNAYRVAPAARDHLPPSLEAKNWPPQMLGGRLLSDPRIQ